MAKVIKCPKCKTKIHVVPNADVLKCECCGKEIIMDNNACSYNYPEELKKWRKSICKSLIIQTVLTALSSISESPDIEKAFIFWGLIYSVDKPLELLDSKPPKPQWKNKNEDILIEFIKIYPFFAITFWFGMALGGVIFHR